MNNDCLIKINLDRLKSTIETSARIGTTRNGGLTRLALTREDKEMRDIFVKWLKDEKLEVRIDDIGNIYGRRKGRNNCLPAVMVGSHLDTQPNGGRFDGILGVLSALEVVRTLNDHNIETERAIEIVNFTNEEGERFTPPMQGSGVVTGNYTKEYVYALKDNEGKTFEQSLLDIGYQGSSVSRLSNIGYFIEMHIEQGPILEMNNKEIGVVQGIKGMTRFHVVIKGQAKHAAHPIYGRKDALLAASEMVIAIDKVTEDYDDLTTTVGVFHVSPSVINIIANRVEFTIDIRHINDDIRMDAIEKLRYNLYDIAKRRKIEIDIQQTWNINGTYFSTELSEIIIEGAEILGYSHQYIASGAGHDAKFMNDIAQSAMIFAPSVGGLSHCEEELTLDEDMEKAANVLLHVVKEVANKFEDI